MEYLRSVKAREWILTLLVLILAITSVQLYLTVRKRQSENCHTCEWEVIARGVGYQVDTGWSTMHKGVVVIEKCQKPYYAGLPTGCGKERALIYDSCRKPKPLNVEWVRQFANMEPVQ